MKYKTIYIMILVAFYSCQNNSSSKESRMRIKYKSKEIEGSPSIETENLGNFFQIKIDYNKHGKEIKHYRKFKQKDGSYYEIKEISNIENKIIDTLYVLTFAKKDTSFTYEYDSEKYPPIVPKGLDDWNYQLSMKGNDNYELLKVNTVDSTFREEYYFDKNFIIHSLHFYHGSDTLVFDEN